MTRDINKMITEAQNTMTAREDLNTAELANLYRDANGDIFKLISNAFLLGFAVGQRHEQRGNQREKTSA